MDSACIISAGRPASAKHEYAWPSLWSVQAFALLVSFGSSVLGTASSELWRLLPNSMLFGNFASGSAGHRLRGTPLACHFVSARASVCHVLYLRSLPSAMLRPAVANSEVALIPDPIATPASSSSCCELGYQAASCILQSGVTDSYKKDLSAQRVTMGSLRK